MFSRSPWAFSSAILAFLGLSTIPLAPWAKPIMPSKASHRSRRHRSQPKTRELNQYEIWAMEQAEIKRQRIRQRNLRLIAA